MTITLCESRNPKELIAKCKDERFVKTWGSIYRFPVAATYANLSVITDWCNNDLKEECLFEVG